jgi:hypothetical protein
MSSEPDPMSEMAKFRLEFAELWLDFSNQAIELGMPEKKLPVVYSISWKAFMAGRKWKK